MSLKYMGVAGYCKHGEYADKPCDKCEVERLREIVSACVEPCGLCDGKNKEIERLRAEVFALRHSTPGEAIHAKLALEQEIERLREAAWIFRTYGLPPEDVSGRAEWNRALLLLVGTDAAEKAGGDDASTNGRLL
jgi:hypothetical protein